MSSRIKELRKEKNMTQNELAKALDFSQQAVSGHESGTRRLNHNVLIKYAEYFDVTVDYLLGRSDRRN